MENIYCDSIELAKELNKSHAFILKKIDEEISFLDGVNDYKTDEFYTDNSYVNANNKKLKRYSLTYKGYIAISCPLSFDVRLQVVNDFNKELIREEGKKARHKLTDAIQDHLLPQRIKENKETSQFVERYITSYTTHIVYKKLNMLPAKGLKVNRDAFTAVEKVRVMDLEDRISELIVKYAESGMNYKDVYQKIKNEVLD